MMFYFKWHIMACKYQSIGIEFHGRHWMNKASSKVWSWCHVIANLKTLQLWHGICISSTGLLDNLMFCVRWLPTTLRLLKILDECRVLWSMTNNSHSNAGSDRRTLSCKQSARSGKRSNSAHYPLRIAFQQSKDCHFTHRWCLRRCRSKNYDRPTRPSKD